MRVLPKTGQHNYYNYMVRYDADAMGGLPIDRFTRALHAEGVPCGSHADGKIMAADRHLSRLLASRHYRSIYTPKQLQHCEASRDCPQALALKRSMVQFAQFLLLGSQSDMDSILTALEKVRQHAGALAKA